MQNQQPLDWNDPAPPPTPKDLEAVTKMRPRVDTSPTSFRNLYLKNVAEEKARLEQQQEN
jgi:hypothetical protein